MNLAGSINWPLRVPRLGPRLSTSRIQFQRCPGPPSRIPSSAAPITFICALGGWLELALVGGVWKKQAESGITPEALRAWNCCVGAVVFREGRYKRLLALTQKQAQKRVELASAGLRQPMDSILFAP